MADRSGPVIILAAFGLFAWGVWNAAGGATILAPAGEDTGAPPAGSGTTEISPDGMAFIKENEKLKLTPYPDGAFQSIGYGHQIQPGDGITGAISQAKADALFNSDIGVVEGTLNSLVTVPLDPNEYDALADLVYDIGAGAFGSSTLLKLLNAGNYAGAAGEFGRWIYSNGVVLPDLVTRRANELALFNQNVGSLS